MTVRKGSWGDPRFGVPFRRSREIGTGKQSTDAAVDDSDALSSERFQSSDLDWTATFQSTGLFRERTGPVMLLVHVSLASLF
jgi:hypothetical protein